MVKLLDDYLIKGEEFKKAKIKIPNFNQDKVIESTADNPVWVHFGGGNRLSPKTYSIKENSTQVLLWLKLMMMR